MKKETITFLLCIILLSVSVSAEISISEPLQVYNLGDKVYITSTIIADSKSGNYNIDLVCGDNTINLQKIPAIRFPIGEAYIDSIPYKELTTQDLEVTNISSILGNCYLLASLGETRVRSNSSFLITDKINLKASLDKSSYNPGERIRLDIEALKENGNLLEGFLEATNASSFSKAVVKGEASEDFAMPETIEAGDYSLEILAYDKGNDGEILNKGTATLFFRINQVAKLIQPSLSTLEVTPGEDLKISVDIYDQSGKKMPGDVSIIIVSPDNKESQSTIKSEEFQSIEFPENATPGTWRFYSFFGELGEERDFTVKEVQKANFEFIDSVLVVRNIGNAVYNKTLTLKIGETEQKININMKVGEERRFNLNAPDGEYSVSVSDNEEEIQQNIMLTGNAISIKDLSKSSFFKNYAFAWIFVLLILALSGTVVFIRFRRKTSKFKDKISFSKEIPSSRTMKDFTKPALGTAESSLVLSGDKNISSVISLRIKNLSQLSENSRTELSGIIEIAKIKRGLIEWKDDRVLIIFNPSVTRTYKNEILAVKTGSDIAQRLVQHNKKFKDKIQFNIGINSGELISSKQGEKLKYTGIGNTVSLARKLSDLADEKVLVSDSIRQKLLREVKVQKLAEFTQFPVYSVEKVADIEANNDKLKDILKRMK